MSAAEQAATLAAKEARYREDLGAVEPIAGVEALLDFAAARGLRCAVVTNAPRANVEAVLGALGLAARLPLWVVGAELARAKPDPLPYQTALARLGAEAGRSVAFEDSLSGLQRGEGRGARGRRADDDAARRIDCSRRARRSPSPISPIRAFCR